MMRGEVYETRVYSGVRGALRHVLLTEPPTRLYIQFRY